jgi:hypothetical protein
MTRSGLRLDIESLCTNEPVSVFKILVIVNTRIILISFTSFLLLLYGSSSPRLNLISARCTGKFQVLHDCS